MEDRMHLGDAVEEQLATLAPVHESARADLSVVIAAIGGNDLDAVPVNDETV